MSTTGLILLLVLLVVLAGAVPVWGYSRPWGYTPSGIIGALLIILLILLLLGYL